MRRLFCALFLTISSAANAQSAAPDADTLAWTLADCAAVYTLGAMTVGNKNIPSDASDDDRAAVVKSYSIAAGKALKASANLSNENTAKDRMTASLQEYSAHMAQDKNMNALMQKLLPCKALMEKSHISN